MTITDQEMFHGRTVRVHSPSRIEAQVSLKFGVSVARLFEVESPLMGDVAVDEEVFDRAMHCLVVLIGGKRLLIQPAADPDHWAHTPVIRSRIYLAESTHGRLVGHTRGLPGYETPLLELSPFMGWLEGRGFNVADVRSALNGGKS